MELKSVNRFVYKMGTFDLDLDERVKVAEVASDLKKLVDRIIKENDSQEDYSNYNRNWSIIATQIPSAEYR